LREPTILTFGQRSRKCKRNLKLEYESRYK
jgi:hypothetical protein